MLEINIPGHGILNLSHLILDYNGTIACDGHLLQDVKERLADLSTSLDVHVLTADTFGSVRKALSDVGCHVEIISQEDQAETKLEYVQRLGLENCVCMGNGRNDRLMLKNAALGVATVQAEGSAVDAVFAADIVVGNILDALDLLRHPLRLTATLRS
ncbi:MAG: ATPase P [Deltaproteobacteria bacterium]|nr:ATPase P [Deltaproteobacteria bacterium]